MYFNLLFLSLAGQLDQRYELSVFFEMKASLVNFQKVYTFSYLSAAGLSQVNNKIEERNHSRFI